jgi:hypothetical protein
MENEIMNYEDEVMEVEFADVDDEKEGMSTGLAVLIGAGITAATVAAVALGKKVWSTIKARRELRKPAEGEIVEVTDADIEDVTK